MMAPYLGTRIILAEPLSNAEFNTMVNGEKAEPVKEVMEGYSVVYPDGYRNWYPKATFEFLYRGFSQGEANFFNSPKPEEKPKEENPSKSNLKIEKDTIIDKPE